MITHLNLVVLMLFSFLKKNVQKEEKKKKEK